VINLRRTKILATLGPATDNPKVLDNVLKAGVNVVRINFSHNVRKDHIKRVKAVRDWANKNNTYIGILFDLQGPKVRITSFIDDKIYLNSGDKFALDANLDENSGNQESVGITYKKLPQEVSIGKELLLDDGRIVIKVEKINQAKIICKVIQGGTLSSRKGINLRGGGLSLNALTKKDEEDIAIAAKINPDYIALSFVASGDDVRYGKKLLKKFNCDAEIISKIERTEALKEEVIKDIIKESAGIMVARGDLGVEIGDAQLPAQQKRLIKLARSNDIVVITATQMLESMIENPTPTRAEIFDVANAVLDGTDTVMLSAETAMGKFPINAVKVMAEVCLEAEKDPIVKISHHRLHEDFKYIDEAISMSTMYVANHLRVKAVAALTHTGKTPMWMSRMSSNIPIYAMSDNIKTLNKVTLYRGVYPCSMGKNYTNDDWDQVNKKVIKTLIKNKVVDKMDLVVLTKGMYKNKPGGTNVMKIIRVGEDNY
jgi:pyruvate kinase